jgi:sRNA-binding protein
MNFVWKFLQKLNTPTRPTLEAKTTLNTGSTAGATTRTVTHTRIHNANQDWRYVIGAVLLGGVAVYWIQGNRAAAERQAAADRVAAERRAAEERAAAERRAAEERAAAERQAAAAERQATEERAAAERQTAVAEHRRLSERIDAMFTAHMDILRMIVQDRGRQEQVLGADE